MATMMQATRRCGLPLAFCSSSEPLGIRGFGVFIMNDRAGRGVVSLSTDSSVYSSRRRFPSKKRRRKLFSSIFLSDWFGGFCFARTGAGVRAGGATTGSLFQVLNGLAKHLTPVLIILKHVKAGAGW